MASSSKKVLRKRKGFRGLQEVESLKKYPSQVFDIQIPGPYLLPSKEGSRLSLDTLVRVQIREYARAFSSLIETCFLTCDKTNYAIAKVEGIASYCLSIGDIFTIPNNLKIPSWTRLCGRIYTPLSNLFYELGVQYGNVKITDPAEKDLEIWVTGDFPNKKAEDWIRGVVQVDLRCGDIEKMKEDIRSPCDNIIKVSEYAIIG